MNIMKATKTLPQGTPRIDNPTILEWHAENGSGDILQKFTLSHCTYYRFVRNGIVQDGYWHASKWSLWSMLDLLNR